MGTWGPNIGEDDAFADIYSAFYALYDTGSSPKAATANIIADFADYFDDSDDRYEAHFALALAQWETQSLSADLLEKLRGFVESGDCLRNWQERGADDANLSAREQALADFIAKISTPSALKKRRKPQKNLHREIVLLHLAAPDGLKIFSVTEIYRGPTYSHTSGMMMWPGSGCGLFHVIQQGLTCSAEWRDAQTLEIELSGVDPTKVQFGVGMRDTVRSFEDVVTLRYVFT